MGKRKERAVRYFVLFLLFMLVCTIVSRGIYAYRMPRVTFGTAESKTLLHKIRAGGAVLTKEEVPVVTEAGLLVEKVPVVEGQKVAPGDVLFWIEPADLEKLLEQSDAQIKAEEEKLARIHADGTTAVNRANQDLRDVSDSMAGEVNQANEAHRAAVDARNAFPSEEDYKNRAYQQDAEYQKLFEDSKKKKATKEEKRAFSNYKKSLDARLSEEYEKERQALDEAVLEKANEVNAANEKRNDAVKQAERAVEDAKGAGASDGSRTEQENILRSLQEGRERLLALKQAEGKVVCEIDGYVSRIAVHAGERTADTSAMVLSDAAGEKLFQAVLPQEEKAYIAPGDRMSLSFAKNNRQVSGVTVEAVGELEDGSCQVTARVTDPGVEIGETGEMELDKSTGRYGCCIPVDALHSDGGSDYVMLVEEQATILGTELTVRKRKVKILDRDEEYAALEDGTLTDEERFVAEADREIKDRERVREEER